MIGYRDAAILFRVGIRHAIGWSSYALSFLDLRSTVLSHVQGDEQIGPRVAVFCHFDRKGRIRDHTRQYIDTLRTEGLTIVFVTNAGKLDPVDLAWLRARAAHIIVRRNLGYDFGAWRDAMTVSALPQPDTQLLLIANDSVYGPIHDLKPALQRIDFTEADVWSATDSWQHSFHLQSYFVAFGPRALAHKAFTAFWRKVSNAKSKWWVIRHYEIGMSRRFVAAGLRCKALWPYVELLAAIRRSIAEEKVMAAWKARHPSDDPEPLEKPVSDASRSNIAHILNAALGNIPLNPTADMWQALIEQGFPFLKRELVQRNPSQVRDISDWYDCVGQVNPKARDLIVADLQRSLRNRAP